MLQALHLYTIARDLSQTDDGEAEQITPKRNFKPLFSYFHAKTFFSLCCGVATLEKTYVSHFRAPLPPLVHA
jgi:hypothetical protein